VPEGLEIELYRRHGAQCIGRRISDVMVPDEWFVRGRTYGEFADALIGCTITESDARGKLMVLRTDGEHCLGIRFGMTGRLVVDGAAGIGTLEYSSARLAPQWDRFGLTFGVGESLTINDPRRLGRVELDPTFDDLGPDARTITKRQLSAALMSSAAPLKARLMDQRHVAGLGNLLCDEVLWRAKLAPARLARSLDAVEVERLHRTIKRTLPQLLERGGSHTGDLMAARQRGALCPRCGAVLGRHTIGGRTTFWCPVEQT
jgi:formamidopyrimidine-DNA glycosylase